MGASEVTNDNGFEIRECLRDDCRLRIPVVGDELPGDRCPLCGGKMRVAGAGTVGRDRRVPWSSALPCDVHVVLDNIRSTFNAGAIMRVADGVGVKHVHMCGITPTPEHRKLAKTALGAEATVGWTYCRNALDAAKALRAEGVNLWALENLPTSPSLFNCQLPQFGSGIALIVGNELTGVDPGLMALSDRVLHLPMHGLKGSLNVAVAFGIAAYWLRGQAEFTAASRRHPKSNPSSV